MYSIDTVMSLMKCLSILNYNIVERPWTYPWKELYKYIQVCLPREEVADS